VTEAKGFRYLSRHHSL